MQMNDAMRVSIEKDLNGLENSVLELMGLSERICDGDDILLFNSEYMSIVKKHEDIIQTLLDYDKDRKTTFWEKADSLYDDLNYIYDTTAIPINSIIAKKTIEMEENYKKTQGLQLAVFSIVLTILAFVLTNAKVLAADNIDFKSVLLVNMSFILSADVFFSLIYIFLGPAFYSKKGKLRFFVFIAFPIIQVVLIAIIAIFMK